MPGLTPRELRMYQREQRRIFRKHTIKSWVDAPEAALADWREFLRLRAGLVNPLKRKET